MRSSVSPQVELGSDVLLNKITMPVLTSQTCYSAGRASLVTTGAGKKRTLRFTFESLVLAVQDDGSTGRAFIQLADLPAGQVRVTGFKSDMDVAFTASWAPTTPVGSVGTVAAAAGATLLTTEANICGSTTLTISSDVAPFDVDNPSRITALTDNSGGTASDTIAAQTGSYVEATQENTVASLAGKINEVIAAIQGFGAGILDGDSTAIDIFLNFACNSDPSTGKTLTYTGWMEIDLELLSDN